MAEQASGTVERTTLYTWAELLGEAERKQVAAMPEPFKEAAAKALKANKTAATRCTKIAETIAKLQKTLKEAQDTELETGKTLKKYADRIRMAVKAAALPVEDD